MQRPKATGAAMAVLVGDHGNGPARIAASAAAVARRRLGA
jgi:hypothetical protein